MATKRTEPYKIYEWLRVNMYHRENGVRKKMVHSVEELEELIEETMERLYILHREEVESQKCTKNYECSRKKGCGRNPVVSRV